MTKREQERCDAALSYLKDSKLDLPQVVKASSYFIAGAKWSDKTMIDKACEWLINIDFDDFHFRDCDETFNNDLFVDSFRKAMEE